VNPRIKLPKPPPPKYHYKLTSVDSSQAAGRMENALRGRLEGLGLSLFSISQGSAPYHIMGDSGASPMDDVDLKKARAVAAEIKQAWSATSGTGR
jgi:hypothetical protein